MTVSGEGVFLTCSDEYKDDITLLISEDGAISGESKTIAVIPVTCNFDLPAPALVSATWQFEGQAYPDRLEIHVTSFQPTPSGNYDAVGLYGLFGDNGNVIFPITGAGQAIGQQVIERDAGWHYVTNVSYQLECISSCGPEPVSQR